MRIAVVGSGISGLAAAWLLARRHDVSLFEADARIGGHTNTVRVPTPAGEQPVDTGFIVFTRGNYPNLCALFSALGIEAQPTAMSFSVSLGDGAFEWHGSDNLLTTFAQPSNLLRPGHWRMLAGILRLNRRCRTLLDGGGELPAGSLGDFLQREGFSGALARRYLLPMAGMIWSCSPRQALDYPAADFMRFFDAHGLFTAIDQPQWYSVRGGSSTYVERLLADFAGTVHRGAPVTAIERDSAGVRVRTAQGEARFDAVVSACHADQALRLLPQPDALEQRVLGGIPYVENRAVVLHTDPSFMPRRRAAWASWNYLHPRDEVHDEPISGTYWMNRLQGIAGPVDYFVTLNPARPVPAQHVLYQTTYAHPFFGAASVETRRLLPGIQGRGGLWFCGAWCGYGFHEDGLRSALHAVAGIDRQCLPEWAVLGPAAADAARSAEPALDDGVLGTAP